MPYLREHKWQVTLAVMAVVAVSYMASRFILKERAAHAVKESHN